MLKYRLIFMLIGTRCLLLVWALGGMLTVCHAQSVSCPGKVTYEWIGSYDTERLETILTTEYADFTSLPVTYPAPRQAVDLYRVSYPTVVPERDNRPVQATGLIAVPRDRTAAVAVVSYQHGTVFSSSEVPSNPEESMETRLALACFASQGYVLIAADYIGRGGSGEPNSYMNKESTAQACLDLLLASRDVLASLGVQTSGELFLSGWSQGSFSTLAFLNRLEILGEPVTAAAFASCPSDLYALVNRWIHVPSENAPAWIVGVVCMLVQAYEVYHELPGLTEVAIRAEYRQTAKDFYTGKIGWAEASESLPDNTGELLEPAFVEAGNLVASPFFQALQANRSYNWRCATPTRFYYGEVDEVMPPYIATLPVSYQEVIGGAASESVSAGAEATHRGAFAFGLRNQQEWFATQLKGAASAAK